MRSWFDRLTTNGTFFSVRPELVEGEPQRDFVPFIFTARTAITTS